METYEIEVWARCRVTVDATDKESAKSRAEAEVWKALAYAEGVMPVATSPSD